MMVKTGKIGIVLGIVLVLGMLIAPVMADTMRTESETNRNLGDYTHYAPGDCSLTNPVSGACMSYYVATPDGCSSACLSQIPCVAATYVDADKTCWLKNVLNPATPHAGMTTFVKEQVAPPCTQTVARFSADKASGVAPLTVTFTDQSLYSTSVSWNFGDGQTSGTASPSHTFSNAGTYTVTQTASSSCNTDTETTQITVTTPTATTGSLSVSTTPTGATLYVDGESRGTTPVSSLSLVPATHTISLAKSGYEEYTQSVTIEAGKTQQLAIVLQKNEDSDTTGSLTISSTPSGAAVYLDGVSKGTTPSTLTGISPNTYTLRLTKDGYTDFSGSVTIVAGQTTPVSATLKQGPSTGTGTIAITSSPSGASVNLDGWQKGTTPTSLQNVKTGAHALILSKDGFDDYVADVTVASGTTTSVSATLKQKGAGGTGRIIITSEPKGANVYLDGQSQGVTPVTLQGVSAGVHNVLLTMKGYGDVQRSVQVADNSDSQIVVDMAKNTSGFGIVVAIAALGVLLVVSRRKK